MKIRGVINLRSGSCLDREAADIANGVADAFGRNGADSRIECAEPRAVAEALRRAAADKPDILIAGGGDGTMRGAAAAIVGTPTALAPIPLGTFNRFARELGIPLDPLDAARALASGETARVDVAEVNGAIFLCNSMLGLPPEFSKRRAELRGKPLFERARGYFSSLMYFASSTRKITISLDDGRGARQIRALSLIVSNNLYAEDLGSMASRPRLDEGVLGVYISRHDSGAGVALAFLRALFGRWKSDPKLDFFKAREVAISGTGSHMRVSTDGEFETLAGPLRYRIRPKALLVLKPRTAPSGEVEGAVMATALAS